MSHIESFTEAGGLPDADFAIASAFINRHTGNLKARFAREPQLVDTRLLFSIWTDKDGTIHHGRNAQGLTDFLCDMINAGFNVEIITGDPIPLGRFDNNLGRLLAHNGQTKMMEKPIKIQQLEGQCLGLYFDDDSGVRAGFAMLDKFGMCATIIDPNGAEMDLFLPAWNRLTPDMKAVALKPLLDLKMAHAPVHENLPRAEPVIS